jgi:hypothetical protein
MKDDNGVKIIEGLYISNLVRGRPGFILTRLKKIIERNRTINNF